MFHRKQQQPTREPRLPIQQLALSFPTLQRANGIRPWHAGKLDRWAARVTDDQAQHAAQFVLSVWNSGALWECGRFSVVDALAFWDDAHHEAFWLWTTDPWWPRSAAGRPGPLHR
jgi:hypothetical protein